MTERPAWHTDEYPELRAGPPWQMEEMIAAEPGLAAPILAPRAPRGVGEAVRAAAGARQPVVVTGCGTSEHAALAVAAQLDEALRAVGVPGGWPEPRQAFEAALDPRPGGVHHRRLPRRRDGADGRRAAGRGRARRRHRGDHRRRRTSAIAPGGRPRARDAADRPLVVPHGRLRLAASSPARRSRPALADRDVPVAAVEAHMTRLRGRAPARPRRPPTRCTAWSACSWSAAASTPSPPASSC